MKGVRLIFIFATLLSLASRLQANADSTGVTLCVNPSGAGGCFETIGAAVKSAQSGSKISVAGGVYEETLSIGGVTKSGGPQNPLSLTIAGAGSPTTIIDGGGIGAVITINPG